jgi:4-amino-4-deoxy-L-arabinose transferase-like glycosyltransferase
MPRRRAWSFCSDAPVWDVLAFGLICGAAILIAATFRDYGITWDEPQQNEYGKLVLRWYTSLFADASANGYVNLYYYGGLFDLLAACANLVSPLGEYETRHLLNAMVGLFGIAGCWRLARTLAGPRAGFLAALLLLLTPSWYGHMFNNPKDVPFAAFFVWSLALMSEAVKACPGSRDQRRLALGLGVFAGMTLAVRVGGAVLFVYLFALVGWKLLMLGLRSRSFHIVLAAFARELRHVLIPACVVAYAVMLAFWPYAQVAPVAHPIEALRWLADVPDPIPVEFEGRLLVSTALPPAYLPIMLAIKLPELVLVLLVGAGALALWRLRQASRIESLDGILLALAILFPPLFIILNGSAEFDGIRHVLFLLPPICCAAAIALDGMMSRIERMPTLLRAGIATAAAGYATLHVAYLVQLHPDESIYYNRLAGGTTGAAGRFDLDYWGNSLREDVIWLVSELKRTEGAAFAKSSFRISVCGPDWAVAPLLPANMTVTDNVESADFVLSLNRRGWLPCATGSVIHRVERVGAVLSRVIDRRSLRRPARTVAPRLQGPG